MAVARWGSSTGVTQMCIGCRSVFGDLLKALSHISVMHIRAEKHPPMSIRYAVIVAYTTVDRTLILGSPNPNLLGMH